MLELQIEDKAPKNSAWKVKSLYCSSKFKRQMLGNMEPRLYVNTP
jgi:hypothetical protein